MTTMAQQTTAGALTARAVLGEGAVTGLATRLRDAAVLSDADVQEAADDGRAAGRSPAVSSLAEGAYGELAHVASGFLDLDLAEVLVHGWRRHQELHEAAVRSRQTGESAVVPLADRDLRLSQSHAVDVLLGEVRLTVVTFELEVAVTGIGVSGVVRDGALVSITSGSCDLEVSFSASGAVLARRTRTVEPRTFIDLGAGIPLLGRSSALRGPRAPAVGLDERQL